MATDVPDCHVVTPLLLAMTGPYGHHVGRRPPREDMEGSPSAPRKRPHRHHEGAQERVVI